LTVIRSARWAMLAGPIILLGLAAVGSRGTVLGQSGGEQAQPQLLRIAFGPEQTWAPSSAAIRDLFACRSTSFTCIADVMQRNGASADAVAFYHLTGWFLEEIQDTGTVQLGTIFVPWRANENTQWALLGGTPAVIFPEEEARGSQFGVSANAEFRTLKAAHPNIMFWGPGPSFEDVAANDGGGQRFTFGYRLLDGCHACAILGTANVGFDFAADGTYLGATLLSVEAEAH
jgi:hypothetical protein